MCFAQTTFYKQSKHKTSRARLRGLQMRIVSVLQRKMLYLYCAECSHKLQSHHNEPLHCTERACHSTRPYFAGIEMENPPRIPFSVAQSLLADQNWD